jgi:hypothetical protein
MQKTKYKYNYPKNRAVGESVIHGEGKLISEITNLSESYVSDVLSGQKNNKQIIDIAKKIIESRERLKKKLKQG